MVYIWLPFEVEHWCQRLLCGGGGGALGMDIEWRVTFRAGAAAGLWVQGESCAVLFSPLPRNKARRLHEASTRDVMRCLNPKAWNLPLAAVQPLPSAPPLISC